MNLFSFDERFRKKGFNVIAGVDESGRGPLAGPLVVSCVVLPRGLKITKLTDSKLISSKNRIKLFEMIYHFAIDFSVVFIDEKEIDKINILRATCKAAEKAISSLLYVPELILIDGIPFPSSYSFLYEGKSKFIIKGDTKSASIVSASIMAKVLRDMFMEKMDKQFPNYGFSVHKGYPTKIHLKAISKYGICDIHRRTYLSRYQTPL